MIPLPDVTLVIVDTVSPDLVRCALLDTLGQIQPAEVLTFTKEQILPLQAARWIKTQANSYDDVAACLWRGVPAHVDTSHYLVMQWDSWVLDGSLWDYKWLEFDYIGAPWDWHRDGRNVGNGGFSLRSTVLGLCVGEQYIPKHPEDDTLCRQYRQELEDSGFKWADINTARKFAFERSVPTEKTFGFHGVFNWPRVLSKEQLAFRISLASDYVKAKPEWAEMMAMI